MSIGGPRSVSVVEGLELGPSVRRSRQGAEGRLETSDPRMGEGDWGPRSLGVCAGGRVPEGAPAAGPWDPRSREGPEGRLGTWDPRTGKGASLGRSSSVYHRKVPRALESGESSLGSSPGESSSIYRRMGPSRASRGLIGTVNIEPLERKLTIK